MRSYFFNDDGRSPAQLSFAICGLSETLPINLWRILIRSRAGGSGKSQTAIRFAHQYRARYSTATIFLNASSQATLEAGFEEISDALQLTPSSNKIDGLKRWLSKSENNKWLLVFDDADELHHWNIQRYFPSVPWGHIILTTRNQGAPGAVTLAGCTLEPLAPEDGSSLLFKRSGVTENPQNVMDARQIVASLGCLPMAVDQAGAAIRASRKSMAEYRELLRHHFDSTLAASPNVVQHEKSLVSAWDVNVTQIERMSGDAKILLLLFCFLDASNISESFLHRTCTPQRRWSDQGEIVEISAEAEGVDPKLVSLILHEARFDAAIEKLESFSLVIRKNDEHGLKKLIVHPLVQSFTALRYPPEFVIQCKWQAILLICHAFPRSRYLDAM